MVPAKRTRLYFGSFLLVAGVGAALLGLRAERFVENRQADIREAHGRRRTELEEMAVDSNDDVGRMLLAEHDGIIVPRSLERYRFGLQVSKSMQFGGIATAVIGAAILVAHVRSRRRRSVESLKLIGK